uniref:Uncharacterized protein n=1 Tax=Zea mays TaxID=4577 RepID=A0A804MGF5_MAIZE
MDVASGLLDHCRPCSFSDDRQELGDDSSSAIALLEESPVAGSERFSFRSRPLELFLLLRLILWRVTRRWMQAGGDESDVKCSGRRGL